jgi:hypothetical protein
MPKVERSTRDGANFGHQRIGEADAQHAAAGGSAGAENENSHRVELSDANTRPDAARTPSHELHLAVP